MSKKTIFALLRRTARLPELGATGRFLRGAQPRSRNALPM